MKYLATKVAALAMVAAGCMAAGSAAAQDDFPNRPVNVIILFPPGGVADTVGRPAMEAMGRMMKQPFVINNRPGAGGATGNAAVANAKPDGYTILVGLASMVAIPPAERIGGKEPTYRLDQFAPLALLTADPLIAIVRAESPWKTIQDLMADAKAKPGKLTYSSSGVYGNIHVAVEMLGHAADLKFLHVPYSGGGPANTALISSQVDFTLAGLASATPFIKGGRARALAVWGDKRLAAAPDITTLKEIGHDVQFNIWVGVFAPAGTPAPIIDRLRAGLRQVSTDQTYLNTLEKIQTPSAFMDAPEFTKLYWRDAQALEQTVKRIGRLEETK